jgi:hypothetical protein
MASISYRRHRFPPVVIQHAVALVAERLLLPSDAAAYVEAAKTCDNH